MDSAIQRLNNRGLVDSIIQRLNYWGSSFTDGDLEAGIFIAMGKERERERERLLSLIKI